MSWETVRAKVYLPGNNLSDPLAQTCDIYLFEKWWDGKAKVWTPEGWVEAFEGAPPARTLSFPSKFVLPLYEAYAAALGEPKPTESTVLREWLDVERKRTDDLVKAVIG
jgi:hypothetical protein